MDIIGYYFLLVNAENCIMHPWEKPRDTFRHKTFLFIFHLWLYPEIISKLVANTTQHQNSFVKSTLWSCLVRKEPLERFKEEIGLALLLRTLFGKLRHFKGLMYCYASQISCFGLRTRIQKNILSFGIPYLILDGMIFIIKENSLSNAVT